jgi:predicted amidophosphoribosyltransferase
VDCPICQAPLRPGANFCANCGARAPGAAAVDRFCFNCGTELHAASASGAPADSEFVFAFEDIAKLDDRAIQRFLKEVEARDLAVALKTADENFLSRIYGNISKRAAATLQEDLAILGPVRMSQVRESQQALVDLIRTLARDGAIVLTGGAVDKDDLLV